MALARPGKNREYSNYLIGLGIGLILGGMATAPENIPTYLLVMGVVFIFAGVGLYFGLELKKGNRGGKKS